MKASRSRTVVAEARPRSPEEVATLASCPEILDEARRRGITEIVHFTTVSGAVGILACGAIETRRRLPSEKYLEHVYRPNSASRAGDSEWDDYVNLSVSRINDWMFDSSQRWHVHEGVSWVVFSFTPDILADPGVVFTTTNNIYPAVRRAEGLEGFRALFAEHVYGRYSHLHTRGGLASCYPTDRQAEVLYPFALGLGHLQRIDVQLETALDDIEGALGGLGLYVPVRLAPEVFE